MLDPASGSDADIGPRNAASTPILAVELGQPRQPRKTRLKQANWRGLFLSHAPAGSGREIRNQPRPDVASLHPGDGTDRTDENDNRGLVRWGEGAP